MTRCSDLASLDRLAGRKEDENWRFREFLKGCAIDGAEIDRIVHELYRQELAQFDCKTCANCCKGLSPKLGAEDVERLSKGTGISVDQLAAEYVVKDEEYGGLRFSKSPCAFLKDDICTCYESRPADCASYPHLHKGRFTSRLANMVANCSVCPIVFNVFERLKDEMKPHGWNRHTSGRGRNR
ncbi:YkgJ family cysteine cluster protein [Methanocella sp. MCL-LM]|uniref:YkgJ family cysteine cluster protein n=1 Tax=Methanocella sp. MCL-LM TaxID=3412035 RepID=UPI003C772FF5